MHIRRKLRVLTYAWIVFTAFATIVYLGRTKHDDLAVANLHSEVVIQQGGLIENRTAETLRTQQQRQQRLAEGCRKLGLSGQTGKPKSIVGRNVLFNDDRKYIYCVVGKVASSTWKQVLLVGTGKVKENRSQDVNWGQDGRKTTRFLPHLADFSVNAITHRLNSYYKFMFVRHPLDRTLSAFRDKFRRQANYMARFGTRIVRRFRGANASSESLRRGNDVTLAEYVRFLIDPSLSRTTKAERFDIHWATQSDLCRPCSNSYHFIGHYETLDDDGDYVVSQLHLDQRAQFPHQYDANGRLKKRGQTVIRDADFKEAFSGVAEADMLSLRQLYAIDYELFGFS